MILLFAVSGLSCSPPSTENSDKRDPKRILGEGGGEVWVIKTGRLQHFWEQWLISLRVLRDEVRMAPKNIEAGLEDYHQSIDERQTEIEKAAQLSPDQQIR